MKIHMVALPTSCVLDFGLVIGVDNKTVFIITVFITNVNTVMTSGAHFSINMSSNGVTQVFKFKVVNPLSAYS